MIENRRFYKEFQKLTEKHGFGLSDVVEILLSHFESEIYELNEELSYRSSFNNEAKRKLVKGYENYYNDLYDWLYTEVKPIF